MPIQHFKPGTFTFQQGKSEINEPLEITIEKVSPKMVFYSFERLGKIYKGRAKINEGHYWGIDYDYIKIKQKNEERKYPLEIRSNIEYIDWDSFYDEHRWVSPDISKM